MMSISWAASNLLEALQASAPDSRLLLMSSAEVYRSGGEAPIAEDGATVCQNPYALSKLAMEMLGDLYWRAFAMKVCKIRAFNFTGPGQDSKFVASDFARQIAMIERGERPPVIRVGNLAAVRDFSDVRDVARYVRVIGREMRGRRGFQPVFRPRLFHSPAPGYPAGPGARADPRRGGRRQVPPPG